MTRMETPLADAPLQRAGPLAVIPTLLAELGVAPHDAFAGLTFGPAALTADARLPVLEAMQLLANCERLTGLEHFGVLVGARCDHSALGIIGRIMDTAPTLGDAMRDYERAQIGYSRGAVVYSLPVAGGVALGFGVYARHHPGAKQAYGLTMALGVIMVRKLTGGAAEPIEILLCHRPPADPGPFRRALRTNVRFDQVQSWLILRRRDLRLANPNADAARHRALTAELDTLMHGGAPGFATLIRHRLKPMLMQGDHALAAVARSVGLHARTLNRRLEEEGTSFAAIRDDVRFQVAQEFLAMTDIPVGDVAASLSFSSHASFVRAFRRWSGAPPTQWRAREMASALPG